MAATIKLAPVRKSITVDAPLQKAFEVFTARIGSWWPSQYSIGKSPMKQVIMEPKTGGRWYEIGEDGGQCDWGEVLEWQAPSRVLLAWRITTDWRYDPDLLTEIDISFVAIGDKSTRVDLEHRLLENLGEGADKTRQIFDTEPGWSTLLAGYAVEVGRSAG
jgi:uncharacterized protein YndB with AHSA1/START domain